MKALSLTQPWATLVAIGAKRIETRSWPTQYRGAIAIHAAKGFPRAARLACGTEPFWRALDAAGYRQIGDLPLGVILARANLVDVRPTDDVREAAGNYELAFGDFAPGRFAWILDDVTRLAEPIPARGALGLWDWEGPTS